MSKEYLEALEWLLANETIYRGKTRLPISPSLRFSIEALQRLEAIENTNLNEALEWLNKFKGVEISSLPFKSEDGAVEEVDLNEVRFVGSQLNNDFRKFVYIIENALIKSQEQEKVLNILKEKPLSLLVFKTFKIYDKDGVLKLDYQYFVDCHKAISEELDEEAQEQVTTEKEFNLLKRYFNEEKD